VGNTPSPPAVPRRDTASFPQTYAQSGVVERVCDPPKPLTDASSPPFRDGAAVPGAGVRSPEDRLRDRPWVGGVRPWSNRCAIPRYIHHAAVAKPCGL